MRVLVREFLPFLTEKIIKSMVKHEIRVENFSDWHKVRNDDWVIFSEEDKTFKKNCGYKCCSIERIRRDTQKLLYYKMQFDYDRIYLRRNLELCRNSNIDTIVLGNSYMQFGVNAENVRGMVNLALQSQDLYYNYLLFKRCMIHRSVKKVIIGMPYYYMFSDLSFADSNELQRINNVYYPIFNDLHNSILLWGGRTVNFSNILDVGKIANDFIEKLSCKSYFNTHRTREELRVEIWADKRKRWQDLSDDEKYVCGKYRAESHNKILRYAYTFSENLDILVRMIDQMKYNKVDFLFIAPPVSNYYAMYIDKRFKMYTYEIVNTLNISEKFIDLWQDKRFINDDFVDTDHLNKRGAEKFTRIILEKI